MIALFLVVFVPVVIHLLVRAPARIVDFPSLRFVQASPMRAVRHRLLSDPALLAVRMAILTAAAAALANPFLPWDRQTWNARVARAIVVDPRVMHPDAELTALGRTFASTRIDAPDLSDGVRRARVWLADAPPARRELVVISDFPLGSIDRLGLDEISPEVGLRLVRSGGRRTPSAVESRMASVTGAAGPASLRILRVSTADDLTRVRAMSGDAGGSIRIEETAAGVRLTDFAIELVGSREDRSAVRAAAIAALQIDVPLTPEAAARPTTVVGPGAAVPQARPLCAPWMGEVGRAVAEDRELSLDARGASLTRARSEAPWVVVLRDAAGSPLVSLAAREGKPCTLLVDAALAPSSVHWPLLIHRVLSARGPAPSYAPAESLLDADTDLRRWSRAPGEVDVRELGEARSHRRAWWLAALGLLIAEWWMRRRRASSEDREVHEPAA